MKILRFLHLVNPIILGLFFILFLYTSNLGEGIKAIEIFSLFFSVSIFSCLVFSIFFLIFRELNKASFLSTILLFAFFSYGYFYDLFNEIAIVKEISRHRYLVPIISILSLLLILRTYRKNYDYKKFLFILSISLSVLILINSSQVLIFKLKPTNPISKNLNIENSVNLDLPDIYHIVLDMYPTEDILETRFNFDNKYFLSQLNSLGFRKENLKANYIRTRYSLPSTINMKHFYNASADEKIYMNETQKSFNKSVEADVARKLGYKIYEISTNDVKNFYSSFFGDFSRVFVRTSMLRIIDDSSIPIHNFWINKNQKYFQENVSNLIKISDKEDKTWTYFYSRPPHPPFIFNEDGTKNLNANPYNTFAENLSDPWNEKETKNFINQLKYVNNTIIKTVEKIILNSKNSIIIIQSDHGVYNVSGEYSMNNNEPMSDEIYEELFSTINFIYSPNNCIDETHNIETNINIISTLIRECLDINISDKENLQFWNDRNIEEFILIK
jgi:hypothetical protein